MVLVQLRSNLLHRLFNQKTALREFNTNPTFLKELLEYEAKHSLDVWCEGFRLLKNAIYTNDKHDGSCTFLYCEAMNDITAKKLAPGLKRQFVYNLRDIILKMKDFADLRDNVHTVRNGWLIC